MPRTYTRSSPEELKRRARARHKERYDTDPEFKARVLSRHYFNLYGETVEDRDRRLADQEYRCAVCGTREPGSVKGWATDHCHRTDVIRGILCHPCNTQLGLFERNPTFHLLASAYLEARK